jgi:dihydroorotate dehydrogenase (NAD+) catalytic subunit
MNLAVNIGRLTLKNPLTVASGTFNYISQYHSPGDVKRLGAVVPKTITLHAQEGNPPPRIVETPAGMVNAIGIQNKGVDHFVAHQLPLWKKFGVPVIVSVSAQGTREFERLAERLNIPGVDAIELNLSCPNLRTKSLVAQDVRATRRVVRAVKNRVSVPVIAKLTPNVTDITVIARAAEEAGADAISMINTFQAMVIDTDQRISKIGNFTGGLSGPAIRPIALHMVYQAAQTIKVPIVAMGGIANADDALQFLIAGATMVAVGTAGFGNPNAAEEVLRGIKAYMRQHKMQDIQQIIGSLKKS